MNHQFGQGGGSGSQYQGYAQGGSQYGGQGGGQGGGYGQGGGLSGGGMGSSYGPGTQSWQGGQGGQQGFEGGPQGYGAQGQRGEVAFNPYTMDKDYDLISVLYHALQAVETCEKYRQDAQRQGSPEIAAFMQQVQQSNLQISQRAKELLLRQRQV